MATKTSSLSVELQTVEAISHLTATIFDSNELLLNVVQLIKENFKLKQVYIYLLNTKQAESNLILVANNMLDSHASSTSSKKAEQNYYLSLSDGQSLVAWVANNKTGKINNKAIQMPDLKTGALLTTEGSELAVPMLMVGNLVGVLDIQATEIDRFTLQDISVFSTLVTQIVVTMQKTQLLKGVEEQAQRLTLLNEMGEMLNSEPTLEGVFNRVASHLGQIIPVDQVQVALLTEVNESVEVFNLDTKKGTELLENPFNFKETSIYQATQHQKTVNISSMSQSKFADMKLLAKQKLESSLVIPLIASKKVIGAIVISSKTANKYKTGDENLMNQLATILASTIENKRLLVQAQATLRETEILYKASTDLNNVQSYADIITVLRQYTDLGQKATLISLNYFSQIWTEHKQPEWIDVLFRWTEMPLAVVNRRYLLTEFPTLAKLLKFDRPTLIDSVSQDDRLSDHLRAFYSDHFKAQSAIFIPMVLSGQWLGFIKLLYQQPIPFSQTEVRHLMAIGGQVAVAVQHLYTLDLAEQQTKELAAINKVLHKVSSQLEMEQLLETVYEQVKRVIALDAFFVGLYDATTRLISYPIVYDMNKRYKEPSIPVLPQFKVGQVIGNGQPILLNRSPEELKSIMLTSIKTIGSGDKPSASMIFVPLQLGQKTIGVMSVQSYQINTYGQRDLTLLNGIANQVAVAIENARLYKESQSHVRREQILRELTARIRSSVDVDTVMQVAVQEIGRTLGRKAFIYLDNS